MLPPLKSSIGLLQVFSGGHKASEIERIVDEAYIILYKQG
jgi:hypothetical protein